MTCGCGCGAATRHKKDGTPNRFVHGHNRRLQRSALIRHGHSWNEFGRRSPTYISWQSMKSRCHTPTSSDYSRYGGRGIKVCERWRTSFENFLTDVGERPAGLTLDRIDNNGDYEPGNVRWATPKEQFRNQRPMRRDWHGRLQRAA